MTDIVEKNVSVIKRHDITLYGGNQQYEVVLRPLTDEHLPALYNGMRTPRCFIGQRVMT